MSLGDLVHATPRAGAGGPFVIGELVRITSNNTVVKAKADFVSNTIGYYGVVRSGSVATGGPVDLVCIDAKGRVLLEAGLTPGAGQTLYISASVAGRATNVAPAVTVPIGSIVDTTPYAANGWVWATTSNAPGDGIGTQGAQGFQGGTGVQGSQGVAGSGSQGSQGGTGVQGATGSQGSQGATGTGAQGATGSQGSIGAQGSAGAQGVAGSGAQGSTGVQGLQGSIGAQGVQGASGAQGSQGASGAQGVAGSTGLQGAVGTQGATGTQGSTGLQGSTGTTGAQGATGVQGNTGAQGTTGAQGSTGAQGGAGSSGAQGSQGSQGPQGAGAAGTIPFTGALVTSAITSTSTYLANPGTTLAVANVATAQRFPSGARTMTALRVTVRGGSLTNSITVTLRKNDVATTMQVAIPSGTGAGTQIADTGHPTVFVAGDDYDVRMDDAADAAAATLTISASLEYI